MGLAAYKQQSLENQKVPTIAPMREIYNSLLPTQTLFLTPANI
jgi:hypothetical protein